MTSGEKISVIVPVYNVEQYVAKCIESILYQTYQNIEVILIDDGSLDESGSICDFYAQKDSRVFVYHKMNEGLAEARNAGVRFATGKYIAFIDSDDYIEPNMLEILYIRMVQDDSDLAICNFLYVDEKGELMTERNKGMPIRDEVVPGEEAFERLADEKYWYYVTACNRLYKKKILEGLLFPKGKIHEDEFVAHYVLDKCRSVSCVEAPLYLYLQREKSITNEGFSVKRLDGMEAFCERAMYAKKRKSQRVAENSLNKAGSILLEGYRRLGKKKDCYRALKEKRKLYNKTYLKLCFHRLCMKTRVKGALIFLHPNACLMVLELLRKGK